MFDHFIIKAGFHRLWIICRNNVKKRLSALKAHNSKVTTKSDPAKICTYMKICSVLLILQYENDQNEIEVAIDRTRLKRVFFNTQGHVTLKWLFRSAKNINLYQNLLLR